MNIHPTAIVDPKAELGRDLEIGPYVIIEDGVKIGDRTLIMAHTFITGDTVIGEDCEINIGAVLGGAAQERGASDVSGGLTIGARNQIREYVTINRSAREGHRTIVGDDNFFLVGSHVGHDCIVGNEVTLVNGVLLAGFVTLEDRVFISAIVGIHQFVKVGKLVMIGGRTRVTKDIPPFMLVEGNSRVRGINVVGMRRAEMTGEQRAAVKAAHQILYGSNLNVPQAVEKLKELPPSQEIQDILDFIDKSERGICGNA